MHAGEGAGDGAVAPLLRLLVARCCGTRESRESGKERESRGESELGFLRRPASVGFYSPELTARPSDRRGRPRSSGPASRPRRASALRGFAGPGPGCGLGAASARVEKLGQAILLARPKEQ